MRPTSSIASVIVVPMLATTTAGRSRRGADLAAQVVVVHLADLVGAHRVDGIANRSTAFGTL